MNKIFLNIVSILAFGLLAFPANNAPAANLDGHMQYRIVSYSLAGEDSSGSSITTDLGPLLITGATSDIFKESFDGQSDHTISQLHESTDVFALSADFLATPDLSVRGAFGITKNRFDAVLDPDYEAGWEANLGVIYNLFNNLRYEIHFGYMDTGDLFKESDAYTDVENIIMISNKLTMSF